MNSDIKSALFHLVIALILQIVVGYVLGMFAGAVAAITLFYGREHDQEEKKVASKLNINQIQLWESHTKEAISVLNPLTWSRGNQLDLLIPFIGVTLVSVVFWLC